MKTDNLSLIEELEDDPPLNFQRIKSGGRSTPSEAATHRHKQPKQRLAVKKESTVSAQFIKTQDDSLRSVAFTYQAARFEQGWLLESLGFFYEQHWISDIIKKIKIGKEASVYLCRSGDQVEDALVAAKVYRPRMLRTLKNDQIYREGRSILDENLHVVHDLGMLKAQRKRSVYGEDIRRQSWLAHEFFALQKLHSAGADVPCTYEMAPRAILMEYIGDPALPAPTLNEVSLTTDECRRVFERLIYDLHLMLSAGYVHGDLSAYNVLYWQGRVVIIDLPQVVPVRDNRNSWMIFKRDVTRLCDYFINQGLSLQPASIAAELWKSHGFRSKPEIDPGLLDANDPTDRQLWVEG